jgi:hypothetical protein
VWEFRLFAVPYSDFWDIEGNYAAAVFGSVYDHANSPR